MPQVDPKDEHSSIKAKVFVEGILSHLNFNGTSDAMISDFPSVIQGGNGNEIELSVIAYILLKKFGAKGKLMIGTLPAGGFSVFVILPNNMIYAAYSVTHLGFTSVKELDFNPVPK
jgi:hypothetical protein